MQKAIPELGAVPDSQLLELLTAESKRLAYQQARVWAVLAEIAHRDPTPNLPPGARWTKEQIFESAVDEVRAELRLTRRSARRELERADAVFAAPRVAQALADGAIDRARAIVLSDGCLDLTDAQTTKVLDTVLPDAGRVTATRLAEQVRRKAVALDPAWAERRYKQAVRERRVIGYLNDDGSATVSGQYLPAEQAAAACARVDALADAAKRAGARAAIDHLRAELFLGLLDGRFSGLAEAHIVDGLCKQFAAIGASDEIASDTALVPTRGSVLKIGIGTLLGLDEQPGEIAGWGMTTASVARGVAARQHRAEWRFAIIDAAGRLLFDGSTRRRPRANAAPVQAQGGVVELHVPAELLEQPELAHRHPAWAGVLADLAAQYAAQRSIRQDPRARFAGRPLRRRVETRFQRCVFPGCRRPATDCDLDHRRDHSRGGRTDEENLAPGCRHDHRIKTAGGWRLVRRDESTYVWISPLGRRHVVTVEPIAAPMPAPVPRESVARPAVPAGDALDVEPSFAPLNRRGRPLASVAGRSVTESDPDPPPF
jgi:hypothetical protein